MVTDQCVIYINRLELIECNRLKFIPSDFTVFLKTQIQQLHFATERQHIRLVQLWNCAFLPHLYSGSSGCLPAWKRSFCPIYCLSTVCWKYREKKYNTHRKLITWSAKPRWWIENRKMLKFDVWLIFGGIPNYINLFTLHDCLNVKLLVLNIKGLQFMCKLGKEHIIVLHWGTETFKF